MHLLHSSIANPSIVQLQHSDKYGTQQHSIGQDQMASYAQTTSTNVIERGLETASRWSDRTAKWYARYRTYKTTLNELKTLSDRELNDLGMHRSQIRAIAAEAAEQTPVR